MRKSSIWLLLGALTAAASLVTSSGAVAGTDPSVSSGTVAAAADPASTTARPRRGGTAIFGADQEPRHLNDFVEGGDHLWAAAAHYPTMAGSFTITPRFQYKPDLVSRMTFTRRPFSVTYRIHPRARWNDGRPITAADYVFTWRLIMSEELKDTILSTVGYEDIRSARVINRKTVRFNFRRIYAGFRDLFGEILPRHCFTGFAQFEQSWRTAIDCPRTNRPIASGPFYLAAWNRGQNMTFLRNTRYWKRQAYLSRIVFRFVEDTNTQIQQIRGGELDILAPQPQLSFAALRGNRNLRIQTSRGPVWEKLDFNLGFGRGPDNPLLRQRFVRRAIAHGINRTQLVRVLLHRLSPGLPVLQSAIIMSTSPYYKQHWRKYNYSTRRARQIMQQGGCRAGGDGIFVCQGRRASFRWMGTSGNQRRELTFEIVQDQLRAAGIEVRSDFSPPAIAFGRRLPTGDFDIADYAWSSGSPDISGWDNIYGCRSEAQGEGLQNRQGYCNRRVDRLLKRGNTELDLRRQANIINQALAVMSNDLNILPLYQLPSMLIHRRNMRNLIDNPLSVGAFWNVSSWWKAS